MNTAPSSDGLPTPSTSSSTQRARTTSPATTRRRSLLGFLPLKIADAYLLRHMMETTLRGVMMFSGLLMMVTVISAIRKVVDNSLDISGMLRLLVSEVPRVLVFTLPMSILFGTVQTFAELSSHGEATALQVGGMSLGRMMRAPLLWGAFIGLCVFVLQERFVPQTQQNKQKVLASVVQNSGVREDFLFIDPPQGQGPPELIVNAKSFDPANGRMTRPSLKVFSPDGGIQSIVAERGVWNLASGEWTLYDVKSGQVSKPGQDATGTGGTSAELQFKMPSPDALNNKTLSLRGNLDKGNFELASITDLINHRAVLQKEAQAQTAKRLARTNRRINAVTYGIHDKIATPWICVFLVLVGAPLALRPQRSSGGFSMGLSLIVLLGYYVLWSYAQAIGRDGTVNPVVTGYVPAGITLIVGTVLFWKKSR